MDGTWLKTKAALQVCGIEPSTGRETFDMTYQCPEMDLPANARKLHVGSITFIVGLLDAITNIISAIRGDLGVLEGGANSRY